jgi:TonB-dependent receptor
MRTVCFRAKYFSMILAMSAFLGQSLFAAGSGTIKGKILDKLTGDPLIGANVIVVGTSLGASSNLDGEVTISNVPTGEKTVKISYIGYLPISEQVVVPEGGVIEKEFRLTPQPIQGQEVVVTAQARGQNEAINQQLASANVTNVVSSEKMKELPDANIAESIGRLPGVSLNRTNGEADKVIIRGMSAQFNNVTIEGVPMVSTSGGLAATRDNTGSSNYADRSIDLSMISDDLVKGVEVSKTLMPNMDANSVGGTINLTLSEAPSGLHADIRVNGGYNDLTKYWKNYKVTGSISDRFFNDAIGVRMQVNAEDKALPSQQFNAGYSTVTSNSASNPAVLNGVTYSLIQKTDRARLTQDNLDRQRYGGSVLLDYASDFVDLKFFNIYTQKKDHDSRIDYTTYTDYAADFSSGWGEFTGLYTIQDFKTEERTHSLQARFKFAGTELDASYAYTKSNYSNPVYAFAFVQNSTPNPYAGTTYNIYAQPSTLINIAQKNLKQDQWYLPYVDYAHNFLNDNTNDTKADYHIPFRLSDYLSGTISLGGKYHAFDRVTNGSSIYFNMQWGGSAGRQQAFSSYLQAYYPTPYDKIVDINQGNSARNFTQGDYTPPTFLKGAYQWLQWGYDPNLLYNIGQSWHAFEPIGQWWVDGSDSYNSNIEAKEQLGASYAMGEFNIGSNLSLVAGARWEQLKGFYSAYTLFSNGSNQNGLQGIPVWRTIDATHVDFFPSVNLKYKLTENIQFFGAYYASASRPNFSDLSPLVDYSIGTSNTINASSNPYLGPALAYNYDLGGSLFSTDVGLFSVDFFYKKLTDMPYSVPGYMPSLYMRQYVYQAPAAFMASLPPAAYFDTSFLKNNKALTTSIPVNNPEAAFARGIELSWQTHLWYLPGILSGLVLDLNVSFMSSNALYPYLSTKDTIKADSVINHGTKIYTYYSKYYTRSGSVLNMPDATYNVIVGWDYLGFSTRVSFRYQKTTLTGLDSKYSIADQYYDNVLLTDITAKQRINDHLSIFASFTNIGAHIDSYYENVPTGQQLPTSQQTYGFSAQFGASYAF